MHAVIPIFCKIVFGRFERGPWHLGKFSVFINAWACLWTLFVSIIFIMPTTLPVTPQTVSDRVICRLFQFVMLTMA